MKYSSPRDRLRANSRPSLFGRRCWLWLGSYKKTRTGTRPIISVRLNGKPRRITVARYIVQFVHGQRWTKRHVGAHSCHNGDWCANPDHVRRDTQGGNVRECVAAGRHVSGFDKSRYRRENVIAPRESCSPS